MSSEKSIASRRRCWKLRLTTEEKENCKEIKEKAQIYKTKKKGLESEMIVRLLSKTRNFIGVFSEDEVSNLTITSHPSFLIVNIDSHNQPGSHWIAIGIFKRKIEIFDPLGFDIFKWKSIPCSLLTFLKLQSLTRKIQISRQIQSAKSLFCGFYCIFYVLARNTVSLETITGLFSSRFRLNDFILIKLF